MKTFCHALCLLCACAAYAAPPEAKIGGPTKAVPGDIIVLDASASTADHFSWAVDTSGVAVPEADDAEQLERLADAIRAAGGDVTFPTTDAKPTHLVLDDGKRLVLSSYPGTYRVNLAVANSEGVVQLAWRLVVEGHGPQPPPVPPVPPPVPPDPPIPPNPTSLTDKVAAAVARIGFMRLEDKAEFALLSTAYSTTLPREIGEAKVTTIAQATARLKELAQLYVVNNYRHWESVARIIETHLTAQQIPGNAKPSVLVPHFQEVAAGIKKGLEQ